MVAVFKVGVKSFYTPSVLDASDQQFFIEDTCTSSPISEPSTSEQIAASATCLESARCGFSCISDPFTTLDDATEVGLV